MNKPANDDSISRVFPKKTNLCFLEALGSLRFLLGRGCPRSGQPIEKPISPRPSGTGIFPYSRMPALKRRPIFKAPLRAASTDALVPFEDGKTKLVLACGINGDLTKLKDDCALVRSSAKTTRDYIRDNFTGDETK